MQTRKPVVLAALLLLCLLCLGGCGSRASFWGTVQTVSGDTVQVAPNEGEDILRAGDLVSFSLPKNAPVPAPGDYVCVTYTGDIAESYPLQVQAVALEIVLLD